MLLLGYYLLTGGLQSPITNAAKDPVAFVGFVIAIFLGITVHEFMHAYVAHGQGDDTGRLLGRLTLNPLAHFDLFGTFLIVVAGFGYGKPVPFNESRLRSGAFGVTLLALAGPLANFVLAAVCAIPLRFEVATGDYARVLELVVVYNCLLGVFNLLPIPPLDGSNVVYGLLSPSARWTWRTYQQYGPVILMMLLLLGGRLLFTLVTGPALFLASLFLGARL